MEEEKTYFTEITNDEKRIINLIRGYVHPVEDITSYVDFLVDVASQKLLEKTIKLRAFTEVMNDPQSKDYSSLEIMARMNQYEEFISNHKDTVSKYMSIIFADMIKTLEGDILPIDTYNLKERIAEEEKVLDKIKN